MIALGVDVSLTRGFDVVALDEARGLQLVRSKVSLDELASILAEINPDAVLIDSPPAFGRSGRSRLAERELARLGISSYATPSEPESTKKKLYDWMREGHRVFEVAARAGYPLFRPGEGVKGTAVEVFPHASAVVLRGELPPAGSSRRVVEKSSFRRTALELNGVRTEPLRTLDQLDAALAALTGVLALEGTFVPIGDPEEGVIVLPCAAQPARYLRVESASIGIQPVVIVPWRSQWSKEFEAIAAKLAGALGDLVLCIDHIGSTSVPGLAAKDVIDVQVIVEDLEPAQKLIDGFARAGFMQRPSEWNLRDHVPSWRGADVQSWRKLVFGPPHGERPSNVHVRAAGSPNERYALLFRDYLRADTNARLTWDAFKKAIASQTSNLAQYGQLKDPGTDVVMLAAEAWASGTGWKVRRWTEPS